MLLNISFQLQRTISRLNLLSVYTNPKNLKDPKEQEEENVEQQTENTQDSNWDEHQRVDEEGNELDPEDIK